MTATGAYCEMHQNSGHVCYDSAVYEVVPPGGTGFYSCTQHLAKAVAKVIDGGAEYAKVRKYDPRA